MAENQKNLPNRNNEINIREELEKYLRFWPWFVLCLILALLIAFLYLRYTAPVYHSSATIIIKDEKNGGSGSELGALQDLGLFNGMASNSLENEMGILRSRQLMKEVANRLDLYIRYYTDGNVRTSEIYTGKPFEIRFLKGGIGDIESLPPLLISEADKGSLKITDLSTEKSFKAVYGEPIDLGQATFFINENSENKAAGKEFFPITVRFTGLQREANTYRSKLQLSLADKNSSLVELSLEDPIKEKASDILDQLILEYNRQAIEDKNLVAVNTANFIDDRLSIITGELDSVETGKENFKENNNLTDIQAESQIFIQNASEFNKEQQAVATQLELANSMIEYIDESSTFNLLPANLGIEESSVNSVISEYNELVLQRNRILSGSSEKNPVVVKLDEQIVQLRANVMQSLQRLRSNLRITKNDLDIQAARIGSKIASVPEKEKQFRGIERQQNIKEALYLYLLQKREENNLSLAITAPKAKVVDSAYSSGTPVFPNPRNVYMTAFLLGLAVPFGFIYLKNLLNNKIQTRDDIENVVSDIPVVGEIPRLGKTMAELIEKNDRSVLAESFRILHTNLQYLLVNSGDKTTGINIFITSTIKGEGKTFVAFNLATTLAYSGKKVLVMGADLRNPQLQRFEKDAKEWQGVSNYLVSDNIQLEKLIRQSFIHENLDLLSSGSIPPNPSELLRHPKVENMFSQLRAKYDYIIVDTAPSMLVADTFLINQYADLTLYVIRAGYTEKKLLDFAAHAKRDGKLHDVSFVLNDVKAANFGYGNKYGYAYGYAYGAEQGGFWKRLKDKAAFW